jgi:hypothetical protein
MKTLVCLLMLAMSVPVMAGPRVVGNGGGGVKQNGVYKTFYSAKVFINPEAETEIPGAELYTSIISSLTGDTSTAKLLTAALPLGERTFFKIAEDKMDETVMSRLIEEYARVVDQTKDSLTIFAITDIKKKTTYLLPTFYLLSEVEQASILFHEAYWILNPKADYSEVVAAEIAFQNFAEAKANGKFSTKLPRLLSQLLNDNFLHLKTALLEDSRRDNGGLIDSNAKISLKSIFQNNCNSTDYSIELEERTFKFSYYYTTLEYKCNLSSENVQTVMEFSNRYPKSYFLKELIYYISTGNELKYSIPPSNITASTEKKLLALKSKNINLIDNQKVGLENIIRKYTFAENVSIVLPNLELIKE